MIHIEAIHIEEFRGIRSLDLTLRCKTFVVSGPNGSGKSGVVDAVQFALTGEIGRLKGAGTGDLSLAEHGPHVAKRDYPDAAVVRLDVFIPRLGKKASITRRIKKPRNPTISPNDPDVRAVFAEIADHPETTFSRREIIKFILTEATQRSRDVQTLLKLDDIDRTRATLKTTENKLNAAHSAAKMAEDGAADALKRHLDLPELKAEDLLAAVNKRRKVLELPEITVLQKDTSISEGLAQADAKKDTTTKESALRDIKALAAAVGRGVEAATRTAVETIATTMRKIEQQPDLFSLVKRQSFIQSGLDLLDGSSCPLCDAPWDIDALRSHLQGKLAKSAEARAVQGDLLESSRIILTQLVTLRTTVDSVAKIDETDKNLSAGLLNWARDLQAIARDLVSTDSLISSGRRFSPGWLAIPVSLSADLEALCQRVQARPDRSTAVDARDFLVVAQERLKNWQIARRDAQEKRDAASRGKVAYRTYCEVAENALTTLYQDVECDFAKYYQCINHDDEARFAARFEPAEGKLGLLVDFHGKGMFPPGAYHSEGHQDGMGACLYLALMRRVLGSNFTFAVLDDVVMSVDSQHRKQFCKLLKTQFPNTQFIITTHDQVWTRQMRTEGLVGSRSAIAFHQWTVATGPVLDEIAEVWDLIDEDLAKNEVGTAAGRLRRHLEYVSADLADELGAKVVFRGDGGYDMGDLLSAVIGRQGELLKAALKAAKSWGDAEQISKVQALLDARAAILAEKEGEQWIINKAVHYNEWADLSREDFRPVVAAFRKLLHQFRCDKPNCDSWLSLTSRVEPTDLRCACGNFRLNLRAR